MTSALTIGPRVRTLATAARMRRWANVDLAAVAVRKAVTEKDFEIVARLRETGFSRIVTNRAAKRHQWLDELDSQVGVFSLIAFTRSSRKPIATMRVQDGRLSMLELARFVPLSSLLQSDQTPAAQFARLTVIKTPQATNAMFGLFKSAWSWCLKEKIPSIVIATPPWSKHLYDFMFFEDIGPVGHLSHELAGGATHVSMRLCTLRAEEIWRAGRSPLCKQFFDISHPLLDFD